MKGTRTAEKEAILTYRRLTEVLSYDPCTGVFLWKISPMGRIKIGQVAGAINGNGHRFIRIDKTNFMAHRLAWFYVNETWPDDELDHIDLVKDNNVISNLREATHIENCRNRKASPLTNTSGYKGVSLNHGRWHAQIKHKGKCYHLGYFDDPEVAHQAYIDASKVHHGEFGRTV